MSGTQALVNEDEYAAVERYANIDSLSDRERLAVEYAERFGLAHTAMDAGFFERMNSAFSAAEIVELSAFVGFCLGIGRIYTVLDIANECPVIH